MAQGFDDRGLIRRAPMRPPARRARINRVDSLNNLDYVLALLIALGALYGLGRGILRIATSLLALLLGIAAAATWYARIATTIQQHFKLSVAVAEVIGYVVVFLAVAATVEFAGRRIVALVRIIHLNWIDRLGGMLLGAAVATAFAGLDVVLLTAVMPSDSTLLCDSRLAPKLLAYNDSLAAYVPPRAKQLYEQKRDDLVHYWNAKNQNPAPGLKRPASGS